MEQKNNTGLIVTSAIVVGLVAVGIYFGVRAFRKKGAKDALDTGGAREPQQPQQPATTVSDTKPSAVELIGGLIGSVTSGTGRNRLLKKTSSTKRDAEVEKLQAYLNALGKRKNLAPLDVDGIFGVKTEARLKELLNRTTITVGEVSDAYARVGQVGISAMGIF